jgi:YggT family protein
MARSLASSQSSRSFAHASLDKLSVCHNESRVLLVLLVRLIDLYSLVVLAAVILSWIPSARNNVVARWVEAATEPVLERIRGVLPPLGGLDLSPMLLLVALHLLKKFIIGL